MNERRVLRVFVLRAGLLHRHTAGLCVLQSPHGVRGVRRFPATTTCGIPAGPDRGGGRGGGQQGDVGAGGVVGGAEGGGGDGH